MRRLNLSTSLGIAGDATTGNIGYSGFTSPTVTEVSSNPDVTIDTDGSFTLAAALVAGSEAVTVRVAEGGYAIEGPVSIVGNGTDAYQYMALGMNLASPTTYSGSFPFANLCHGMGPWTHMPSGGGSGAFTQSFGTLTADVATDIFRAYLSDHGVGLPTGTYTVRNPDECEIAFGPGENNPGSFTTLAEFTVDLTEGVGAYLFVKGSLTNNIGPLEIIMPGHTSSYDAGNIWSNSILAYYEGIGAVSPLRFMDFTAASNNKETEWSQRTPPNAISFANPCASGHTVVPWEHIIDLSNRLNADAWICVPARASVDYIENCAAVFGANLNPTLRVYPERGNELWNFASAWYDCAQWANYFGNTKYVATANYGANTFTYAGHGMTTGNSVRCFDTPENEANSYNQNYPYSGTAAGLSSAAIAYVEVVDANTFKLYSDVGRTTLLTVAVKQLNQIFIKSPSPDAANHGNMLLQNWDAFDAELGVDRVVHVVASQSASTGVTASRFSNTAMAARADCVATAPYFNGYFFAGQIVTASGQFTPAVWCNASNVTFRVAIYAAGSTPTIDEVMDGAGAGFVYAQTGINYTIPSPSAYWRGSSAGLDPITGLSNGTTYEVFFVLRSGSERHITTETITATASATTITVLDTYANQAKRMMKDAFFNSSVSGHSAAAGGLPVICYEAGPDFNADQPSENYADIEAWRVALQESAEYADANKKALYTRATQGYGMLAFFSDCGSGSFSLANSYADTADLRYAALTPLNGRVRVYDALALPDITPTVITNDPGSFPYTVHTFSDASLNYALLPTAGSSNYVIVGNELRMVADYGIDWTPLRGVTLSVLADNGYTCDFFTVYVQTGAQWYETGALIDIDYQNDRAYVGGVDYASVSAARTAGAIVQTGGIDRIPLTGIGSDYVIAGKGITGSTTQANATSRYLLCVDDGADGSPTDEISALAQTRSSVSYLNASLITGSASQLVTPWESATGGGNSTAVRIAARIKANDSAISFNGGTVIAATTVTIPAVTQLVVGNRDDGTRAWTGTIHRVAVVNASISDADLVNILA